MLVQRVLMPVSSLESWTVLGDEGGPVEPIERYLAYLTDIERSPNTVKAYAHDLKDWFGFLDVRGLDWREVRLEDLGEFVAWLRLPPAGRGGRGGACCPRPSITARLVTVNRKLSAISGLYTFHARHGVDLGDLVTELQPVGRRRSGWKPFLYHLACGRAGAAAHDQAAQPAQAADDPDRRPGPGDPGRVHPAAGSLAVGVAVGHGHTDRRGAGPAS